MKRIAYLLLLVLSACGTPLSRECYRAHPNPSSLTAGSFFGIIGVGMAYALDGKAIREAGEAREECIAKAKAE